MTEHIPSFFASACGVWGPGLVVGGMYVLARVGAINELNC